MKKLKIGSPNKPKLSTENPQGQQRMPTYKPRVMTQKDMNEGLKKAFQGMKREQGQQQPRPLIKTPQPQPEPQQEPYWSAQQWEEWALELYNNYAEYREILPMWFLQAIQ